MIEFSSIVDAENFLVDYTTTIRELFEFEKITYAEVLYAIGEYKTRQEEKRLVWSVVPSKELAGYKIVRKVNSRTEGTHALAQADPGWIIVIKYNATRKEFFTSVLKPLEPTTPHKKSLWDIL